MRQKSVPQATTSDKFVKDIRRATLRHPGSALAPGLARASGWLSARTGRLYHRRRGASQRHLALDRTRR